MTLVEAFQRCGPCTGAPDDTARGEAAALLYEELLQLHVAGITESLRIDAVHTVLVRFMTAGPRGVREGDPDSDERVKRYFRTGLLNVERDRARAARRFTAHDVETLARPENSEDLFEPETIGHARSVLSSVCIPGCAAGLRSDARANFERAIAEREEMSNGGATFVSIVERHGTNTQTTRNAVYKQHSRALLRLGDYVKSYIEAEGLARTDAEALRIVYADFCRGEYQ
jgi:hypothetical protein